jgi:hypothetical protein
VNAAHSAITAPLRVALLGNPNCGKTALFNLLTGSRQKVANYAGVTVERKEGHLQTASGRRVLVLDLPGAYSLNPLSADEAVTRDVVTGRRAHEPMPDLLVCVVDATNLKLNLRLVLEARALGLPMVLTLNMSDMAVREGIVVDRGLLSRELAMPVLETVGVRHDGAQELLAFLDLADPAGTAGHLAAASTSPPWHASDVAQVIATQQEVRRILAVAVNEPADSLHTDDAIDRIVLHPSVGNAVAGLDAVPDVPSGVQPGHCAHGVDQGGRGCAGQPGPVRPAARRSAESVGGRHPGRHRRRAGVFTPDPDPFLLHHRPGGFRLPTARGVPAGPGHGDGWPVGALVHSIAVQLRLCHSRCDGHPDHQPLA